MSDPVGFNVTVYPNPSSGQFTIAIEENESATVSVIITNIIGQPMFTKVIANTEGAFSTVVDISSLPPGNYFAKITGSEKRVIKIVKE